MNCEHGHHCPYTGRVEDLQHALLFIWPDIPGLDGRFHQYSRRFKAKDADAFREIADKVRELYNITIDFEFGYDEYVGPPIGILRCEKFKKSYICKSSGPVEKETKRPGRQRTLFEG